MKLGTQLLLATAFSGAVFAAAEPEATGAAFRTMEDSFHAGLEGLNAQLAQTDSEGGNMLRDAVSVIANDFGRIAAGLQEGYENPDAAFSSFEDKIAALSANPDPLMPNGPGQGPF